MNRFEMKIDRVDSRDRVVGKISRADALAQGAGFRVVHVLVTNAKGELLLQQVAPGLRSSLLWGSSVSGYVKAGERYSQAAHRKLRDELGINAPLTRVGKTSMRDGESTKFITVFQTTYEGGFSPDPKQVKDLRFVGLRDIHREQQIGVRKFTPTFDYVLELYAKWQRERLRRN